jgi:hypothetical protein
MTRLVKDARLLSLAEESGAVVSAMFSLPGADDPERLLVAALVVAGVASTDMGIEQRSIAREMSARIAAAIVFEAAKVLGEDKGDRPS